MTRVLLVGLGGFIGSIARYGLQGLVHWWLDTLFPAGTVVVNALGCLLIGAVMSLVEYRQMFSPGVRVFLTIGILGGFTTFSTFGFETFEMLRHGSWRPAGWYVAGNVVLGLAAVFAGWSTARFVWT
jgi:fluoride exporter